MGSYAERSIAESTPPAERHEISCSLPGPPHKIATRIIE